LHRDDFLQRLANTRQFKEIIARSNSHITKAEETTANAFLIGKKSTIINEPQLNMQLYDYR